MESVHTAQTAPGTMDWSLSEGAATNAATVQCGSSLKSRYVKFCCMLCVIWPSITSYIQKVEYDLSFMVKLSFWITPEQIEDSLLL